MAIKFVIDGPIRGTIHGLSYAPGAAPSSWEYASLAAAESSGDSWKDGNEIIITGGATFTYYAALAVNGHSGLIHKEPYGSGNGTISASVLRNAEGPNTDPDTWGGSWNDASTGVKGVDYELDVSTNSRLRDLTTGGRALMAYESLDSDDTERFVIIRDLRMVLVAGSAITLGAVYAHAYKDASNVHRIRLESDENNNSGNYYVVADAQYNTSLDSSTARHVWLYVKNGNWAFWINDDATPELSGASPSTSTANTYSNLIYTGQTDASGEKSDMYLSTHLHGGMTTA